MPAAEITPERIAELYTERRKNGGQTLQRLQRVRDAYNGELVVSLPDAANSDPAVANLVMSGIDQTAGRIASVMPMVDYPPTRPGERASERRAATRRKANLAWWERAGMRRQMRQRSRFLIAYGSAPATIVCDYEGKMPGWNIRNPLQCMPNEDLVAPLVPADNIVAVNRPFRWLQRRYPAAAGMMPLDTRPDAQVTLLEYNDHEQTSLVLAGLMATYERGQITRQWDNAQAGQMAVLLEFTPNRAGQPMTVIPQRSTLDKIQGQFDQAIGLYLAQAELGALEMIAVKKGVFPDTYLVGRTNEIPDFVAGPYDGRSGEVNIVKGGDIKELTSQPGYMTTQIVDRLERGLRMSGNLPSELSGESGSNIRTGKRGDAVLSAAIDFPIGEAHDALAEALHEENRRAIALSLAYFGSKKTSFYLTLGGKAEAVTYDAKAVFAETDEHTVRYPVAGADANGLVVSLGQRVGIGTMSKKTAATLDPMIDDPEREHDFVQTEALEQALLSGVQQGAVDGSMPAEMIAQIIKAVAVKDVDLAEAVVRAKQALLDQQAAAGAQAQADQAGLVGLGGEQPGGPVDPQLGASVPQAEQGVQNLAGMLTSLRKSGTRDAARVSQ